MLKSDKTYYLNADRSKAVPEDSEDAAYLLVREGGEIAEADAKQYGLKLGGETKAQTEAPKTKAATEPRNIK